MGWRIVQQPNERYALFSEIVDAFTFLDMDLSQAVEVCQRNVSDVEALQKCTSAILDDHRWEEALDIIKEHHGKRAVNEVLKLTGLQKP